MCDRRKREKVTGRREGSRMLYREGKKRKKKEEKKIG
jgi:hypothetical protein